MERSSGSSRISLGQLTRVELAVRFRTFDWVDPSEEVYRPHLKTLVSLEQNGGKLLIAKHPSNTGSLRFRTWLSYTPLALSMRALVEAGGGLFEPSSLDVRQEDVTIAMHEQAIGETRFFRPTGKSDRDFSVVLAEALVCGLVELPLSIVENMDRIVMGIKQSSVDKANAVADYLVSLR